MRAAANTLASGRGDDHRERATEARHGSASGSRRFPVMTKPSPTVLILSRPGSAIRGFAAVREPIYGRAAARLLEARIRLLLNLPDQVSALTK